MCGRILNISLKGEIIMRDMNICPICDKGKLIEIKEYTIPENETDFTFTRTPLPELMLGKVNPRRHIIIGKTCNNPMCQYVAFFRSNR